MYNIGVCTIQSVLNACLQHKNSNTIINRDLLPLTMNNYKIKLQHDIPWSWQTLCRPSGSTDKKKKNCEQLDLVIWTRLKVIISKEAKLGSFQIFGKLSAQIVRAVISSQNWTETMLKLDIIIIRTYYYLPILSSMGYLQPCLDRDSAQSGDVIKTQ